MSDETYTLVAKARERTGSRYSKRIREAGGLPAVVYGRGKDPVSITLDAKETISHIAKGEKVFELTLDGSDARQHVIVKDLQYDYLGTNIVHADLARIELTDRVDVSVPLHLVGDAPGLRTSGAIMTHPVTQLELNVLVTNLPDFIEVDVSEMQAGDVIHAGDVKLPKDTMKLLSDPEGVVAHVVVQAEDAGDGEEAEVSGDAAQPEVLGEKKDEGGEG